MYFEFGFLVIVGSFKDIIWILIRWILFNLFFCFNDWIYVKFL